MIRDIILQKNGLGRNTTIQHISKKETKKAILLSIWHLLKLVLLNHKYENVIYSYERYKVNGVYMDKFTDPLVDYTNISNSFVIFEPGWTGRHYSTRMHSDKIVYTDFINSFAYHTLKMFKDKKKKYYSNESDKLCDLINNTFPDINMERKWVMDLIITSDIIMRSHKYIFKKIGAKRLIGPFRSGMKYLIPAAKMLDMKVYELQHGITYSESNTYSGYIDPLFSPDLFLTFGSINAAWRYGITEDKVVEIGWAFNNYIKEKEVIDDNSLKVLVISSPEVSEEMVSATCLLAKDNPEIEFYFRPHPREFLGKNKTERLNEFQNIRIDNNEENVTVTLMLFNVVVGENSTVLYEAISMGKKVGKLHFGGLEPRYLSEDDIPYFYEIRNNQDFIDFIKAPMNGKPSKNLYSTFKPDIVNKLLINK